MLVILKTSKLNKCVDAVKMEEFDCLVPEHLIVSHYNVQPEPEEPPEKEENSKQERNISEKQVEIEKAMLTETKPEALHQAERARCLYVFSKKLMLLRLVCTVQFSYLLKERQDAAWDKGTPQYLHVILTFMSYVAAKGPVSDDFRNAFRAHQIAEIVTRILRWYKGSKEDYWQKIHNHSVSRFEVS
jgi:hypothetical protein